MFSYSGLTGRIISAAITVFLSIIALLCVLPFIHVIAKTLSGPGPVQAGWVGLVPAEFTIDAYRWALGDSRLWGSFINSFIRLALGVSLNMAITVLAAFPLSFEKRRFPGRTVYAWFFLIIILFEPGILPNFVLLNEIGLTGTIWALILPRGVQALHIFLLLIFFRGIPSEIIEATWIDGASHFRCLMQVMLPLVIPALATLALYSILFHWNSWLDGFLYLKDTRQYPLQTFLYARGLPLVYIVISIIPLVVLFPFLQRHMNRAFMLGAVKG